MRFACTLNKFATPAGSGVRAFGWLREGRPGRLQANIVGVRPAAANDFLCAPARGARHILAARDVGAAGQSHVYSMQSAASLQSSWSREVQSNRANETNTSESFQASIKVAMLLTVRRTQTASACHFRARRHFAHIMHSLILQKQPTILAIDHRNIRKQQQQLQHISHSI